MKKQRLNRKLTLNTETVRHLKDLTVRDLGQVHGGDEAYSYPFVCSGYADCPTTVTG